MRDKYKLSPALPVQEGWSIAVCPHKLAAARLVVFDAEGNKASILYDPEGKLHDDEGCWEVHPYEEDVAVLALDDIEGLTEVIQAALRQYSRQTKRGIWWLAVDRTKLDWLKCAIAVGDSFEEVEHLHVTLAFDVTEDDRPQTHNDWWPEESDVIRVKGLAHNSKCACLVVDIGDTDCCNKHPHITLALAEGVQPVYSNDMLAGKDGPYTYLPLEATLEGRLEFKPFD